MENGEESTKVLIGPENVAEELKDTSVVLASYDIGDGMKGVIGVVGPTRMDYAQGDGKAVLPGRTNLGKLFNGMSDNTLSPPPRQKALGPSKSDPTDDDSSD